MGPILKTDNDVKEYIRRLPYDIRDYIGIDNGLSNVKERLKLNRLRIESSLISLRVRFDLTSRGK